MTGMIAALPGAVDKSAFRPMAAARKMLRIAVTAAALAAASPLAHAGTWDRDPATGVAVLPAHEILTTVRTIGLAPITDAVRRGPYYVLHAYDPYGFEVRVVADAQLGDILSVTPATNLANVYTPLYERAPHIIHVSPSGEEEHSASPDEVPLPRKRGDGARR